MQSAWTGLSSCPIHHRAILLLALASAHSIKPNHDVCRPIRSFKKLSMIVHSRPKPRSNYVACFVVKTLGKVLKVGVWSLKLLC